jgi:hypothetical protein
MDSMNLDSKSGLVYLKMNDGRTNGNITMPTMEVLVDVGRFEVVWHGMLPCGNFEFDVTFIENR